MMAGKWIISSKNNVFRTLLLSYLLIFLLPLLVLIYFSNRSLTLVEQQLDTDNRLLLEQFYSGVDTLLLTVQRAGDQLAFDTATSYFSDRDDLRGQLNSAYAYQNIKHLQSQLSNVNTIYGQIQNSYIYYTYSNRVLSSDGVSDSKFFFNQRLTDQYSSYMEWMQNLASIHDAGFIYKQKVQLPDDSDIYKISYIRRIQWHEEQLPIYAVITLNTTVVNQQTSLIGKENKLATAVFNSNFEPIYISNPDFILPSSKIYEGTKGWFLENINNKEFRISWIRSDKTGCIYLVSIPKGLYSSSLKIARTLNFIILFTLLFLGILLSFLFARKSYHPIKTLMEFIAGKPYFGVSKVSNGDDFRYLREVLEKLADDKSRIENELTRHKDAMKKNIIERLLYSNIPCKLPPEERLEAINLRFDTTDFAVIILKLDNQENKELHKAELSAQLSSGEIWEEMLGRWYNAYTTEINGDTVLLVNFRGGGYDEQKSSIKESMCLCHKMIHDKFGVSLSLYVSDIQHTFAGIHKAFRDILSLSEYNRKPGEVVLAWEALTESSFDLYYSYKPETEQKLINLMMAGDIDEAKNLINKVHSENIKKIPLWFEKVIIIDLLSSCVKAMSLVNSEDISLSQIESHMRELLHDDPENYSMTTVLEILEIVCELARRRIASCKSVSIDEKVVAIIQKEYSNSELSVASIAEQLNINPSYATALYKKRTGQSIADSINSYRLNKAVELLTSTSKDIKDIATSVGFYNSAGFIRAFKRCRGITPGQYRNMNSQSNSLFKTI